MTSPSLHRRSGGNRLLLRASQPRVNGDRPLNPSLIVGVLAKLPLGRRLLLRLYNRALMHLYRRQRATTFFGSRFECDVRDMIQATIIHLGSWEPRVSAILVRLISRGDTVIDVGANIGYYSLLFSKAVGPDGSVVAVEALPKLARIVDRHATDNGLENIRVVNAAVSDHCGTLQMYEAPGTNIGMSTIRPERGFRPSATVPCAPLHELVTDRELRSATFIKIDIEGAELPVLQTIADHLHLYPRLHSIAVETNDQDQEWPEMFRTLLDKGFSAYNLHNEYDWLTLLDDPMLEPTPLASLPRGQVDLLFTRRELEGGVTACA